MPTTIPTTAREAGAFALGALLSWRETDRTAAPDSDEAWAALLSLRSVADMLAGLDLDGSAA